MRKKSSESTVADWIVLDRYEEAAALLASGFGLQKTEVSKGRVQMFFHPEAAGVLEEYRLGSLVLNAQLFAIHLNLVRKIIFSARREGGLDNES